MRILPSGKAQLPYYDENGKQCTAGVFANRSAANRHFRDVIEPKLNGTAIELPPTLTLADLFDLYVERNEGMRSPRTIQSYRERMQRPLAAYGETTLAELETMALDESRSRFWPEPRSRPGARARLLGR